MNVLDEMTLALSDHPYSVENAMSLGAVEMYKATQNSFWIKVWIELNADRYNTPHGFANDLMEVFDL